MKHHRIPTTVRAAALAGGALLAVVVPATAGAEHPGDVTCGSVVTGDVRLPADLTCDGPGLVIGAHGIRIDLGGHTLSGSGAGIGIDNNGGFDGVTIRNGTIAGFQFGTDQLEASGTRIQRVSFTANGIGISLGRTDGVEVDRVTVERNAFDGMTVNFSEGTSIRRSVFTGNGVSGINELASYDTRYERVTAVANALHGITISQSAGVTIGASEASGNGGDGINLGFWAEQASLDGNRTSGNVEDGVQIDEAGNTIRRHAAFANGGIGIAAAPGTLDGGRNRATGNAGGDCTAVTCR